MICRRSGSAHLAALLLLVGGLFATAAQAADTLLNVSYDVARSYYKGLNQAFATEWKAQTGRTITIDQSHGGSSKQARAVIDGLEADVLSMNNPLDIDQVAKAGLLPANWATQLPNNSAPTWSPILFLVRKGNPKHIRDWDDLIRRDVKVIIPNPKTSGNGRYSYLAGWEWAKRQAGGKDQAGRDYVRKLFANVPVLDTGGRGATTTFAQRGVGDVLLTFENEIGQLRAELGGDQFEVIVPSLSVRADNPVAVVEKNASAHHSLAAAQAYLKFHYSSKGQQIAVQHYLRTVDPAPVAANPGKFPKVQVFRVEEAFGSWPSVQATHFANGGVYDQIQKQH